MVLGARTSWSTMEKLCQEHVPEFQKIIAVFGAPQIRHVGTIGGNIVNASPIADSLPFLHVMESSLELCSTAGTRLVNINKFYQGYKKFDLRPGELVARVLIPLPRATDLLRLYKISRRRDLDISTFTAAIRLRLDGDTIADAAISLGAVGPIVIRARKTESFLRGRPLTEETMLQAGEAAVSEITPISDVRGAADYRFQLTRNILLKFYHETQCQAVPV
jgi:xanthine dehydrogenase small subunit